MATLHLGVTDIPYAGKGSTTTYDVAMILEEKYGIMEAFVAMHEKVIEFVVENSVHGAIESLLMGGPANPGNAFAGATSEIEELFRDALTMQSYDFHLPGVPTQAALNGVSHRFKRPYVKRDPRPSFIDTGLYQNSFRAWTS